MENRGFLFVHVDNKDYPSIVDITFFDVDNGFNEDTINDVRNLKIGETLQVEGLLSTAEAYVTRVWNN